MDSSASTSYSYTRVDVEDDVIGDLNEDLRRSGGVHALNFEYQLFVSRSNFFLPVITFTRGDLDGDVFSYNGLKLGGSYTHLNPSFMVNLDLFYDRKEYDEIHPIFNTTREDQTLEVRLILTKFNPFGFKNYSLNLIAGYAATNSRINFYDSTSLQTGIEIGYKF